MTRIREEEQEVQPAKPRVQLWTSSECYNSVGLFSQQLECGPISFRLPLVLVALATYERPRDT